MESGGAASGDVSTCAITRLAPGTGDSDLTWQGIAGVGYAFKGGEIIAAWRYLDYVFKSGKSIESLHFSGPGVGVAFRC
jgi:hypothetical protein